ncbi:sirohydrochlorin chelatase [Winogradskya consettensis]|uniref:Cobalamin biosynthesis protein CbiX n=1 Tax=Winogradskya consettensis TaxID=113560 RepID=A0A919VR95_9ACTN|nr:CbiX/SirB N-terminal domain-containing protein [Actinoplanes consettensis]GIM73466.1 cobalamin biosynthesis protein CbiX [Actinoplanes consettensis]
MRRLVAVAHGTRSVAGQEQIRALVDRVALRLPGTEVRLTYVDVQHPRVETMAFGVGTVVVPLLLSTGHHVRVDIANAVAGSGAVVTPPLGPDAVLVASMRRHLSAAASPWDAVVLAAAGSSDPGWRAEVDGVAAQLGATVAYASGAERRVADVVREVRDAGARRVGVAAYLLAEGLFYRSLHRSGADLVTPPLCAGPVVEDLVVARYVHAAAVSH